MFLTEEEIFDESDDLFVQEGADEVNSATRKKIINQCKGQLRQFYSVLKKFKSFKEIESTDENVQKFIDGSVNRVYLYTLNHNEFSLASNALANLILRSNFRVPYEIANNIYQKVKHGKLNTSSTDVTATNQNANVYNILKALNAANAEKKLPFRYIYRSKFFTSESDSTGAIGIELLDKKSLAQAVKDYFTLKNSVTHEETEFITEEEIDMTEIDAMYKPEEE